jgi:hypothetical protein
MQEYLTAQAKGRRRGEHISFTARTIACTPFHSRRIFSFADYFPVPAHNVFMHSFSRNVVPCFLFYLPPSPQCMTFQFPAVPLSPPLTSMLSAISVESIAVWTAAVPLYVPPKQKKQNNLVRIIEYLMRELSKTRIRTLCESKINFSR